MENTITIREFNIDDLELLLSLRMEVLSNVFSSERKEISDKEWNDIREENEKYYVEELEKDGHIACGIYVSGEVVGCGGVCLYKEMPSPDNRSGKCAYLMNIYVRKAYRRQGFAKKICNYLVNKAKSLGADKIYLESSDMAVGLYKSLGFASMNGYMKLSKVK
ncbi:Ribosomal protein S18 acetylase RimI [Lachnospiraceae bacterium C7]|nr:Ribosomal protein S18 acetylase RimI [Lachnospiraceae bacterium C7]